MLNLCCLVHGCHARIACHSYAELGEAGLRGQVAPPLLSKPLVLHSSCHPLGVPTRSQPFEDEETRAFYEDLVDLRAYVPAVLLGPPDAGSEAPVTDQETGSAPDDGDADVSAADVDHGDMSKADDPLPEAGAPGPTWPGAGPPVSPEAEGSPAPGAAEEQSPLQKPNELQAMLARLPVCVSREEADEAALAFCYAQSKAARKRLVRTLCDVPGGALALLPFFARIAATLGRIWPDIPAGEGLKG